MLYTIHRHPAGQTNRWATYDGSIATVYPILPQDTPLEAALVEGPLSEPRYVCSLVGGGRLIDEMLTAYTQIDYVNHIALVVSAAHLDGTGKDPIVDGRLVVENGVIELATLVTDVWQGKNVGRRLLATLVRMTRVSGAQEVFGEALSVSRRMINLTRDAGFHVVDVPGDAMICTVRLLPAQAEMAMTPFASA